LNAGAKWLWRGDDLWSFDFTFHPGARAGGFVRFESEVQFREQIRSLAQLAATEAQRLTDAFPNLRAVANRLKEDARNRDGWPLYHAAVAAFLAGRSDEAKRYFTELSVPKAHDYPTADWIRELRADATRYAEICRDREKFRALLTEHVQRSRVALGLPVAAQALPADVLHEV
jgi:hypothetical protein